MDSAPTISDMPPSARYRVVRSWATRERSATGSGGTSTDQPETFSGARTRAATSPTAFACPGSVSAHTRYRMGSPQYRTAVLTGMNAAFMASGLRRTSCRIPTTANTRPSMVTVGATVSLPMASSVAAPLPRTTTRAARSCAMALKFVPVSQVGRRVSSPEGVAARTTPLMGPVERTLVTRKPYDDRSPIGPACLTPGTCCRRSTPRATTGQLDAAVLVNVTWVA